MRFMRRRIVLVAFLASVWFVTLLGARAWAEDYPDTVTIENHSGDPVRVEVIGPSAQVVELADNESRTVNVTPGEYSMHVRYGSDPKTYSYSKVAPFKIERTATTYTNAVVTIDCSAARSPDPIP
jgi:hypothetical protein